MAQTLNHTNIEVNNTEYTLHNITVGMSNTSVLHSKKYHVNLAADTIITLVPNIGASNLTTMLHQVPISVVNWLYSNRIFKIVLPQSVVGPLNLPIIFEVQCLANACQEYKKFT